MHCYRSCDNRENKRFLLQEVLPNNFIPTTPLEGRMKKRVCVLEFGNHLMKSFSEKVERETRRKSAIIFKQEDYLPSLFIYQ